MSCPLLSERACLSRRTHRSGAGSSSSSSSSPYALLADTPFGCEEKPFCKEEVWLQHLCALPTSAQQRTSPLTDVVAGAGAAGAAAASCGAGVWRSGSSKAGYWLSNCFFSLSSSSKPKRSFPPDGALVAPEGAAGSGADEGAADDPNPSSSSSAGKALAPLTKSSAVFSPAPPEAAPDASKSSAPPRAPSACRSRSRKSAAGSASWFDLGSKSKDIVVASAARVSQSWMLWACFLRF